jgi:hypothetical protein
MQTLFDIAAAQKPSLPAEEGQTPRPLLRAPKLMRRLGPFVARTLENKKTYVAMLQARDALLRVLRPLFLKACDEAGALLTAADVAGGRWEDPEGEEAVDVADAQVQYQCLVELKDLEAGSIAERDLSKTARELMPAGIKLELRLDVIDEATAAELLQDLGAERIKKWFKLTSIRRIQDAETVRKLHGRGEAGQKLLAELERARAIEIRTFPKYITRTSDRQA